MQLLANGKQQFIDQNGAPLAGGLVYHYQPNTSTPATTYQDQAGQTANSNPITLDSNGQATIWGSGSYRQVVKKSDGTQVWDQLISTPDVNAPLVSLSASAGSGLVGFVRSEAGAVAHTVQDKLRESVSVRDFGAVGDGVTDDTTAFVKAIAASDVVFIPPGNYLVSTFTINKSNFSLIGAGYDKSIITPTAAANVTVQVATTANVSGLLLQDFKIQGNATALGGIALGTSGFYCAIPILHRVHIWDFSLAVGTNGFGVQLNQVQNVTIHNCWIYRNRHGIQRPNVGYCTSTKISGKSAYLGMGYIGLFIDGQCDDVYIDDVVVEGNNNSGIMVTANAVASGKGSSIYINGAYLESNNASGAGAIYVVGSSGAYQQHVLVVDRCNFATNTGFYIALDQVIASIRNCKIAPSNVSTTANTSVYFQGNRYPNGANYLSQYRALLGNISVSDSTIPATNTDPNQVNFFNAITFPSPPRTVTDANTLDDYQERVTGQWVPTAASFGGTINSIAGYYVKVGRIVHFEVVISGTSLSSTWTVSTVTIPFPTASPTACAYFNGSNGTGGSAYIDSGTTKVLLPTIAAANATLVINGTYIASE